MKEPTEYPTVTCHICNKDDVAYYNSKIITRMVNEKLCFSCLFWVKIKEQDAVTNNWAVINSEHIIILPDEPESQRQYSGCGGSEFTILFNDGRKIVTHNLWHQGTIPEHFKYIFPNNAKYV